MSRTKTSLFLPALHVALALAVAACSGGSSGHQPPPPGADSFVSMAPGGAGGARNDAGAPATPTAGNNTSGAPASGDGGQPQRAIEEADIYKLVGSTLYVLNAYRGLEIVDLSSLAAPRVVGRLPVTGLPVDLYVHGTVAFVAVSDAFAYYVATDGSARSVRGSRFLTVDVSNPAQPAVLSDLPISGEVQQTRVVGEVLYVVSHDYYWYLWGAPVGGGGIAVPVAGGTGPVTSAAPPTPDQDQTFVASFDLSDPRQPRAVAKLSFPVNGWSVHANVTEQRITLALSGWDTDGATTQFQVVDISDPGGALATGAAFSTRGTVPDRWAMDQDDAAGVFRAVVASSWNGGAALQTWATPDAATATPLGRLELQIQENLTASRFDGPRVYVVTALRTDPLWAVDATDPAKPVLAGELQMPGQLDYVEPRGDRLVALGHTSEAGQPWQLAVSLIDVTQLASPQLLSRVTFGGSWSWVSAQPDDMRKAFIVLDPPPAGIGLILVPVQGWDYTSYQYQGGTQLIDYGHDALALRGLLPHPGSILRAFPADASGTKLAAFSDTLLQTIDATDRDHPAELGRTDLARCVQSLAVVEGHAAELTGDWYLGDTTLVVTDARTPDGDALARVPVPAPYASMLQDGDVLWLVAHDWRQNTAWLQAVDLTDPLHPALRGRLDLAPEEAPYLYGWWWGSEEAALVGHTLAVHASRWVYVDCSGGGTASGGTTDPSSPVAPCAPHYDDTVQLFDLSNPDAPRRAATVEIPGNAWAWGLQAHGPFVWLSHFEYDSASPGYGRYYVDRVDVSDADHPSVLARVNVPGFLAGASDDGAQVYTFETWWDSTSTTTYLHVLALDAAAGKARLQGSATLAGAPSGIAFGGGYAWVGLVDWNAVVYASASDVAPAGRSAMTLAAVDLGHAAVTSTQSVAGSYGWVRKAAGGKLFVQAGWADQGVLVYGLSSPAKPALERFVRTQGWIEDIVVADGVAYLPSGPYGVPTVALR